MRIFCVLVGYNSLAMKNYLPLVLDTAFYLVAGFFLFFIPVNFFIPRPASIVVALSLGVMFTLLTVKLSLKKQNKKFSSLKQEKRFNAVMTTLNLAEEKNLLDLFEKAFRLEGYEVEKRRGGLFIAEKKTTAFFKFGFDGVTKTDIVKCFNKIQKSQKAEIFAENFSEEVSLFAERFGGKMILSDGKRAFELLEKHGLLPKENPVIKSAEKPAFNFRLLLDKKRAKNYLAFGLLFSLLSFIAPIKGYYLAFGAGFLIFALFLKLFGESKA